MDRRLRAWADRLDHDGWAACLLDPQRVLVWVSHEMKEFLDETDEHRLGYGEHFASALTSQTWRRTMTPESQQHLAQELAPYLDQNVPVASLPDDLRQALRDRPRSPITPEQPALLAGDFQYCDKGRPSFLVRYIAVALREADGTPIGTLVATDIAAPATLVSLLAKGDRGLHERMAQVVSPDRHPAAIVFADLPGSAQIARRLPTAVYFQLIQQLTAKFDQLVCDGGGVVGKHVGDGMTAFFLGMHAGDDSGAAGAALRAVARLQEATPSLVEECIGTAAVPQDVPIRFDVGLHWGANLYMGQLVPGSRLEVTALGDEVNECARIQEAAKDGCVLASKQFVEILDVTTLQTCGIDTTTLVYRPLGALPTVTAKGTHDAANLAVTRLEIR